MQDKQDSHEGYDNQESEACDPALFFALQLLALVRFQLVLALNGKIRGTAVDLFLLVPLNFTLDIAKEKYCAIAEIPGDVPTAEGSLASVAAQGDVIGASRIVAMSRPLSCLLVRVKPGTIVPEKGVSDGVQSVPKGTARNADASIGGWVRPGTAGAGTPREVAPRTPRRSPSPAETTGLGRCPAMSVEGRRIE